ncbi:right-handed parallel beta-helix repeat-containing protein, partial [Thermodesulfobacteriota bacterium]
ADYFVSPEGSDSNPGTAEQPWQTIQKAADTLTAGEMVYIMAGTYAERVVPKNSGSAGSYIVYAAYPGDTVTIDGSTLSVPSNDGLLYISEKSYIKISGLKIANAGPTINSCAIFVEDASYITLENNHTYNTVSSGIGVWDSSNIIIDGNEVELACNNGEQECISIGGTYAFEIMNNHVHDSGPGTIGGEGICVKDGSYNGKVYNNHVHDLNNRLGIYIDAWDKHTYNIDVYRNIVHDIVNNDGFTLASETGGLLENIKIYNNIAYNNELNGITVSENGERFAKHPMQDIYITNNTFYNNGRSNWGGGIIVENPDAQDIIVRNNICSQNVFSQIQVEVTIAGLTIENNLIDGYRDYETETYGSDYVEADPLFVNAAGADFHLQEHSPAIDAGAADDAPADDYDGNARPRGAGYDIGAFEFTGSD